VTIVGDTIVAGAFGATLGGNALQGEAYVFVKPIGGWKDMTETAKLTAADGQGQDLFGHSISISGNTVAIGAEQMARGSGKAYVFVMPASGWTDMTQTGGANAFQANHRQHILEGRSYRWRHGSSGADLQESCFRFCEAGRRLEKRNDTVELSSTDAVTFDQFGSQSRSEARPWWSASPRLPIYAAPTWRSVCFRQPAKGWKTTAKFNQRLIAKDKAASLFGASVSTEREDSSHRGTLIPVSVRTRIRAPRTCSASGEQRDVVTDSTVLPCLLHRFTPLTQKCGDVEIGLLEIRDHGVSHAID
jgi:hypothetical protein